LPQAEQLLRHAIALQGPSYAPLRSMQKLLLAQGREVEAVHYADLLKKRQDEDPYYWLGMGLAAMQRKAFASAVDALERAAALTSGFEEIHRNLAIAYWRNGQRAEARKQLKALTALNSQDPAIALLSSKMRESAPDAKTY
jgi:Flp pilus assembly protein TadD